MNRLIKEWLEAEKAGVDAYNREKAALASAARLPLPERLRPATAADVVEGAILWYPPTELRPTHCWKRVDEVMKPDDAWKGYVSHDGCRYGLRGAFVEVEQEMADAA